LWERSGRIERGRVRVSVSVAARNPLARVRGFFILDHTEELRPRD
jgi:hypothetical protein